MISGFFFFIGVLSLIHSISIAIRFIRGYLGKTPDIAKKYNTKWILVTGASSGVGKFLAIKLSKQGFNIIGAGRNVERLADVAKSCRQNGVEFREVIADFAKPDSVDIIMKSIADIDVGVFLLAAGLPMTRNFFDYSEDELVWFMNTMVINQAELYAEIIKKNKDRDHETLINVISSLAAHITFPTGQMYCAVKAFTTSCLHHLSNEIHHYSKIKVQIIQPGPIKASNFYSYLPKYVSVFINVFSFMIISSEGIADLMIKTLGQSIISDITFISANLYFLNFILGKWFVNKVMYLLIPRNSK